MRIETEAGAFFVDEHAHDWGSPVEGLDLNRLSGSQELMALFYALLTLAGHPGKVNTWPLDCPSTP